MIKDWIRFIAMKIGSPGGVLLVLLLSSIWIIYGIIFGYAEDWHLWMDIPATLLPFIMLFFLQLTQNFDSKVTHTKLDEVLLSLQETDNDVAELEEATEEKVEEKRRLHREQVQNR